MLAVMGSGVTHMAIDHSFMNDYIEIVTLHLATYPTWMVLCETISQVNIQVIFSASHRIYKGSTIGTLPRSTYCYL